MCLSFTLVTKLIGFPKNLYFIMFHVLINMKYV